MNIIDNDLLSIQEARILIENAMEAQKKLATFSQEKLDEIVFRMLEKIGEYREELAKASYEETDCGNLNDKKIKDRFIIEHLKQRLNGMKCVGIIGENKAQMTKDIGVPVGVITAFCPMTSPVAAVIYKATIAIKSGNAIVFALNPKAKKVMKRTLDILIEAAEGFGLPEGAFSYLSIVAKSGFKELMNHKGTSIIMNTGVVEVLDEAYKSGKPVIYGGAGNGPAFIERTANIKTAVKDIIISKSFDYGIVSGAEQSVVVDSPIAKEVEKEFLRNGAYFMSKEEEEALGNLLFDKERFLNEWVGKSPQFLAKKAGFVVHDNIKVLVSKQKYVSLDNPYSREKLCPVLSFYIEDDWMEACEKCIELLLSEKQGHTLIIHSENHDVIEQFALKKPVGRMLVNTSGVFGSMGATTNLFPSMTLGSGVVGKGMTSDNVSPMNLIYIRKIGYSVCDTEKFIDAIKDNKDNVMENKSNKENEKLLQDLLVQVLKGIK